MHREVVHSLTVCNVKGRFIVRVPQDVLFRRLIRNSACKISANFSFVTVGGLKYSVFDNSRWVNVTGLSCFADLQRAADDFCKRFGVTLEPDSVVADNSTVVGHLDGVDCEFLANVAFERCGAELDQPHFTTKANGGPFVVLVRTRWFPSLHLRPGREVVAAQSSLANPEFPRLAACTVFPSGKIIVLGARSLRDARYTAQRAWSYLFDEPICKCWTSPLYEDDAILDCGNVCIDGYDDECASDCACRQRATPRDDLDGVHRKRSADVAATAAVVRGALAASTIDSQVAAVADSGLLDDASGQPGRPVTNLFQHGFPLGPEAAVDTGKERLGGPPHQRRRRGDGDEDHRRDDEGRGGGGTSVVVASVQSADEEEIISSAVTKGRPTVSSGPAAFDSFVQKYFEAQQRPPVLDAPPPSYDLLY